MAEPNDETQPIDELDQQLDDALDGEDLDSALDDGRDEGIIRWANVWQLPVLVAGVVLLVAGVWTAMPEQEDNNFPAALDSVEQYLAAKNFDDARDLLDSAHEYVVSADDQNRARYAILRGDLIYLVQKANGWQLRENYQKVISNYGIARELGYPIDGLHLKRWADSLVGMGRYEDALSMLDKFVDQPAEYSYGLIRDIIEQRRLDAQTPNDQLRGLLVRYQEAARLETDPSRRRQSDIWNARITSDLMLEAAAPDEAIDYLNRRIVRLKDQGDEKDLAGLIVNLARAYHHVGRNEEAETWFHHAQDMLDKADPLNADILVGLGRIAKAERGDVQMALGHFSAAQTLYPSTPAYFDALVGRADCEAHLGAHQEAIDHFGQAVDHLLELQPLRTDRVERMTNIVRSHYDLHVDNQQHDQALDYLSLLVPLYPDQMPAPVLLDFAVSHERLARQRLEEADVWLNTKSTPGDDVTDPVAARRAANQEAAAHYEMAANYYVRHARAVTVTDNDAHGASLWAAANCYDKAQLWSDAIDVYAEFVNTRPGDPRHLEAVNRLGMAYLADGQYEVAADQFKTLIERHPNAAASHASLVPLARAYIATDEPDLAQRLLESVIYDHPAITPEASHYRDALVELGRLHYNRQQFEAAIPILDQAVQRYGDTPDGTDLKYRLADAYRQSVAAIDETLAGSVSQSAKLILQQKHDSRLEDAMNLFNQVVSDYEARPKAARDALDSVFLRNAYFYRADCAFDLKRYEQAIALYDIAAKRYENHPASLVALIQQVNAHCELGQYQAARVANDRARFQLRRIPDEAFNDPSLPMTRSQWEDWLKWTSELNLFDAQANAATE